MKKIRNRIKSIIAMTLVATTIITSGLNFNIVVANAETANNVTTSSYGLAGDTEDGVILHAWNWSFNNVKKNMKEIAEAGYTSVQVSPIQPSKDDSIKTNSKWWILYQPVAFEVGNAQLGTEEEFKAMCDEADKYGIKIIVDVVANHTGNNGEDGNVTIDPHVSFKDNEAYWHTPLHGVKDWNDRYEVTHGGIGLPDLNTSNKDLQNMVRAYLEKCLKDGADGFRFDAAKHIELPTDDDKIKSDFWPTILNGLKTTDGTEPYIYGEVLQGGADNYDKYTDIMHVTTSNYGNDIRKAVGFGSSANVSNAMDYDVPEQVDPSRLVTWVESHDTYANDSEESTGMTSEQIKNGWAIIAARADSTPLYFNRTVGRKKLQGNIGDVGNDDWKDPDIIAVNKFHNAMINEDENLVKVNKEIIMIERGNKGVVIVNFANDCSLNQDINLEDGTYNNCATTGGTFTVSGGKITGTLSKGITVLYKGGVTEQSVTMPKASISKEDCSFYNSLNLTLNVSNSYNATYSIDGIDKGSYVDGTKITIGEDAKAGDTIKVVVKAATGDRTAVEEYTYIKKDESDVATVYFKKQDGEEWQAPYAYIYNELGEENAKWPGQKMTKIGNDLYKYELKGFTDSTVIINDWFYGGNQTENLELNSTGKMLYNEKGNWAVTADLQGDSSFEPDSELKSTAKVYFKKPEEWTSDDVNVYFYKNGASGPAWPGVPMEKVEGKEGLYTYTLPKGLEDAMVLFNSTVDGQGVQVPKDTGFKAPADTSMIYDVTWKEYVQGSSKVYFRKPADWGEPNVYAYKDAGGENKTWPGEKMEKVSGTETLYSYTLPEDFGECNVIFNDVANKTKDLLLPTESSKFYDSDKQELRDFTLDDLKEPEGDGDDDKEEAGSTVYVKLPEGWNKVPNMHYWNTAGAQTTWPGKAMKDEGNGIYSCEIPKSFGDTSIIINDGNGNKLTDSEGKNEFTVKLGSSIIFEDGVWKDYVKPNPSEPENPEKPDDDKKVSKAPKIDGEIYTTTTKVTGIAGADADVVLTIDDIVETTTSDGVSLKNVKETKKKEIGSAKADKNGRWSADISKQDKGTVITITAAEEGKEPASIEVKVKKGSLPSSSETSSSSSSRSKRKKSKTVKESKAEDVMSKIAQGNINIDPKKPYIEKDVFDFLAKNRDKIITLIGDGYSWTFKGSDIINASILSDDMDTRVTSTVSEDGLIKVHFGYEGILPGKAKVQINVDSKYNNSPMYLYVYNNKLNKLELLAQNLQVKDNSVIFEVTEGTDYILSQNEIKGSIKAGWNLTENNSWIFIENSNLVKGWKLVDNNWYLMDVNGIMRTGWNLVNSKWYYLNEYGVMKTGWVFTNGKWYYLSNSGAMLSNTTVNGYVLGNDGAWIK